MMGPHEANQNVVYSNLSLALTAVSAAEPSVLDIHQDGREIFIFKKTVEALRENERLNRENQLLKDLLTRHSHMVVKSIIAQIEKTVKAHPDLIDFIRKGFKWKEEASQASVMRVLAENLKAYNSPNVQEASDSQEPSCSPNPIKKDLKPEQVLGYRLLWQLLKDCHDIAELHPQIDEILSERADMKELTNGKGTGQMPRLYHLGQGLWITGQVFYFILTTALTTVRTMCLVVNTTARLTPIGLISGL